MTRDMTKRAFDAACKRYGITPRGFLGYYALPCGVEVSVLNAGPTRREQIAYLLAQEKRWAARFGGQAEESRPTQHGG